MRSIHLVFVSLLTAAVLAGCASHSHSHYAGMESRDIKALSPSDIEGLEAGRGMSMALPAELNGYPGPLHVLELAGPLALTPEQTQQTRELFSRMQTEAKVAGKELIARERELDRHFASKSIDPTILASSLLRISESQARVRQAHLQAHLAQVAILSAAQVAEYNRLRGYK